MGNGFSFYNLRSDGRWEFFVDASLLKNFSLCERYMYLQSVKNLRPKGEHEAKPFAMAIGCWWSNVMERFYNKLRDGEEIDDSDIINFATEAWVEEELDLTVKAEPKRMVQFGDITGAVLMLKEYLDRQYMIDKTSWKVISVEQGFGLKKEVFVGENDKVVVYWIGKPDLLVAEQGKLIPVDHKTVDRIIPNKTIHKYKPSTQMPGYCFATEVIAKSLGLDLRVRRVIINLCCRTRPSENPHDGKVKPRFIRAYPMFTPEEISEWRRRVVHQCTRIAHNLEKGEDSWAWSETTCHNMYMRDCPFLQPDSVTPTARELIFERFFKKGEPWVPYKVHEE